MNLVHFKRSLIQCEKTLKELNVFRHKGPKNINIDGVSDAFKYSSQEGDYIKIYRTGLDNLDYDFLLFDESFFQFSIEIADSDILSIRYAFFQNPQSYKSYEEFLETLRESGLIIDETNEMIGDTFHEDYNQFLSELNFNSNFTTIRYDYDSFNYHPLIHSISHFHIGTSDNVRIPCDKIISPIKFLLFVLKHTYYYLWKEWITAENKEIFSKLITSKRECKIVNGIYWNKLEQNELFIT